MILSDKFRKYMEEAIGVENARVAFSAFEETASTSIRFNPCKPSSQTEGRPVVWCRHGLMLDSRPVFTLDPIFHAGGYYVQDSSSMFVGHAFRTIVNSIRRPEGRPFRVLDLCAAPGGKTTDIAASLREICGDDFLLVSNEVMKARAGVLADNVAVWGDPNVVVTSDDPSAFASLYGFFDLILADVPCSGEGMFRKDEQAQQQWSEDNVALCAARQKRIVADVWPSLAEGGVFIYSTCTFNRYENDDNVKWIAEELGAECMCEKDILCGMPGVLKTALGYSLVPGHVEGEGQYCSALRKTSVSEIKEIKLRSPKPSRAMKETTLPNGVESLLNRKVVFRQRGETLIALPENLAHDLFVIEQYLHVIASGCAVGTLKGNKLIPDADLALSLMCAQDAFPSVETDLPTALEFLHRDSVHFPGAPMGYLIVKYNGLPLGFVKNIGNRSNNLHPQSRRIRMNIR